MSEALAISPSERTPWHIWVVGILTLLWNGSGAITILLAQAGRLPGITAEEAAYYANQATWFVVVTDIATLSPFFAGFALMLRSKVAVWLFGLSLACMFVNHVAGLIDGTSRMLANTGALIASCVIIVLAILQFIYARAMHKRGVLR